MSTSYAIASAFLYALSCVITRFGLRYFSTSSGFLFRLLFCFGSVLMLTDLFLHGLEKVTWKIVVWAVFAVSATLILMLKT